MHGVTFSKETSGRESVILLHCDMHDSNCYLTTELEGAV